MVLMEMLCTRQLTNDFFLCVCVCLQLVRTKIQEVLQQLPLENAVDAERPLTLDELVDTCLDASSSTAKNDPMRYVTTDS